jgi:hypothetical protein
LDPTKPTVTVCRGCCCGTTRKHPTIDHEAQLANLRSLIEDVGNLRVTDCLGPCERSNVIAVSPSRSGRLIGGRPTWLGFVLDAGADTVIATWLRDGGPGLAGLPDALMHYRFERARGEPLLGD